MSLTFNQAADLFQHQTLVVSRDRAPLGVLAQLYVDEDDQPLWAAVVFDPPSQVETVAPVHDAFLDGADLVVPYGRDLVESGPRIAAGDELPWVEEQRLRQHYGLSTAPADTALVKPITELADSA